MLTMGAGIVTSFSRKQKLNAKNSIKSELIGDDDALPQILWTRYFVACQEYKVSENIIFQDNKSTLIMEKNGKASSSKKTKHIKVRYFLVKDKIEKGEVQVKYCPSEKMWSDVLTKPLHGEKFRKMRSMLMKCSEHYYEIPSNNLY